LYARYVFALLLLLLTSCLFEAEEAFEFPNYVQASLVLPGTLTVEPVFSQYQNYCIAAVEDTLYHLELHHGRIHGKTALPGTVSSMAISTDGFLFAAAGESLCAVKGFDVIASAGLPAGFSDLTVCGNDPLLLMDDGTMELLNPVDLSVSASGVWESEDIVFIQGFSGMISIAASSGTLATLSLPGFSTVAETHLEGSVTFLDKAGSDNLLFSCSSWNEAASCSPSDLKVEKMFTFPAAPVEAAADSSVSFIYCTVPGNGIMVCRENGDIAWKASDYGSDAMAILSSDGETAVLTGGNRLNILIR